jgi:hypothetical protein
MREKTNSDSRIMRWLLLLLQFTFGIKYDKGSENPSDSLSRVHTTDLGNKSFDYNFTQTFVDETDIELNVIHVSNGQLEESKEIFEVLFYGLNDPKSIENLVLVERSNRNLRTTLKVLREFSMGLVERSNRTIQDFLDKMRPGDEDWDLNLPLAH